MFERITRAIGFVLGSMMTALLMVVGGFPSLGAEVDAQLTVRRAPVPEASARTAAEKSVDEVFGREIAAARSAEEKAAVAQKILGVARDEKDPGERYALLNRARTLATAAGDVRSALQAVQDLVDTYEIDAPRARLVTVQALARSVANRSQQGQLAESATSLLEEALARDDVDAAIELGSIALGAARKSGNAELQKHLVARAKEVQNLRKTAEQLQPLRAKLAVDPNDPEANLAVGQHECFDRRDWSHGLPKLAKGSDPTMKAAALMDLASPGDSAEQMKLADQWWDLAEKQREGQQEALRLRARHWYREALPELKGLARARAEKRLGDASEEAPTAAPARGEPTGMAATISSHAASGSQRALIEHVAQEIKAKKTITSAEPGFTLGKQTFSLLPDDGGLLVGLDFSIGTFNKITGIRPLFLTRKGMVVGPVVGEASLKGARMLAKRGYAVGAVTVSGGLGIDGLSVTFMRIEDTGLNPQQSYDTPLIGNATKGTRLGGDGAPIVGIFGHRDERQISAMGVLQVEKRK